MSEEAPRRKDRIDRLEEAEARLERIEPEWDEAVRILRQIVSVWPGYLLEDIGALLARIDGKEKP